jgi:hypothetical protein
LKAINKNFPNPHSSFCSVQSQIKILPIESATSFAIYFEFRSRADTAIKKLLAVLLLDWAKRSIVINLMGCLFGVKVKLIIILQAVLYYSSSDDNRLRWTHSSIDLYNS